MVIFCIYTAQNDWNAIIFFNGPIRTIKRRKCVLFHVEFHVSRFVHTTITTTVSFLLLVKTQQSTLQFLGIYGFLCSSIEDSDDSHDLVAATKSCVPLQFSSAADTTLSTAMPKISLATPVLLSHINFRILLNWRIKKRRDKSLLLPRNWKKL